MPSSRAILIDIENSKLKFDRPYSALGKDGHLAHKPDVVVECVEVESNCTINSIGDDESSTDVGQLEGKVTDLQVNSGVADERDDVSAPVMNCSEQVVQPQTSPELAPSDSGQQDVPVNVEANEIASDLIPVHTDPLEALVRESESLGLYNEESRNSVDEKIVPEATSNVVDVEKSKKKRGKKKDVDQES